MTTSSMAFKTTAALIPASPRHVSLSHANVSSSSSGLSLSPRATRSNAPRLNAAATIAPPEQPSSFVSFPISPLRASDVATPMWYAPAHPQAEKLTQGSGCSTDEGEGEGEGEEEDAFLLALPTLPTAAALCLSLSLGKSLRGMSIFPFDLVRAFKK